ncbi:phosphopentomutase [Deinococcus soli (ex Cha et al. 2016)]|uniref:Phosphopentomutase n=2 Tax=Deinococcus soli (ex Cha et al. 2016) TaxID=1309411 RepID=A0AAE3XFN4_9DEIO|nr:phosphopentomutase [Deinococcus soli (ex Cha et al. 2016)]MDR6220094.1 phosphopentomutase [Deinococcus soli (ex Cha et al. 2016)]MDR6329949.1 phosphopentomutase [Deinococcus soli (ex Cha et al. 2016)]MDR6754623.1 phosphopentomutase [Deinococcus soli (ex Cha et al. 2016)]GGB74723.1 phosphopentomutase [Deinococcus soli (ex Cha et al. 2016)]
MLLTIVVLDSVGAGELPDAASFGDAGAHTLNHTLRAAPVRLPNLAALGLAQVPTIETGDATVPAGPAAGAFGRLREVSPGKDTSTGHWEFMGVQLEHAFQVFPDGFPPAVMDRFDAATGRGHLCNRPYSGTDVIRDFGPEHLKTGAPIVYTSADSVFQIAAHEDVVPLETLYAWCRAAREILQGEFAVARVIARPFRGEFPFERANEHRKDFSLVPPPTVLDAVKATGQAVVGIGKIPDIYANQGFTEEIHTDDNADGIAKTLARMHQAAQDGTSGLIFTNLVDFDSKFGHRRDPEGYSACLAAFDAALPDLIAAVPRDGALIIISDHGNDPTWKGSDHTREHGLLLVHRAGAAGVALGDRATFADVGATVAEALGAAWDGPGESFWTQLT